MSQTLSNATRWSHLSSKSAPQLVAMTVVTAFVSCDIDHGRNRPHFSRIWLAFYSSTTPASGCSKQHAHIMAAHLSGWHYRKEARSPRSVASIIYWGEEISRELSILEDGNDFTCWCRRSEWSHSASYKHLDADMCFRSIPTNYWLPQSSRSNRAR